MFLKGNVAISGAVFGIESVTFGLGGETLAGGRDASNKVKSTENSQKVRIKSCPPSILA